MGEQAWLRLSAPQVKGEERGEAVPELRE